MMLKKNLIALAVLGALLPAGIATATPNDPSSGECDGLDSSSGLFSLCLRAHSARNRVAHLQSRNANQAAIDIAQAEEDSALAQYSEVSGGAVPPGYVVCFDVFEWQDTDDLDGWSAACAAEALCPEPLSCANSNCIDLVDSSTPNDGGICAFDLRVANGCTGVC